MLDYDTVSAMTWAAVGDYKPPLVRYLREMLERACAIERRRLRRLPYRLFRLVRYSQKRR